MTTDAELLEAVAAIVGSDAVLSGEAAAPHFKDWRGRYTGKAIGMVFPSDTQQVSEVRIKRAVIALLPQTNLAGYSLA
ncbi:MAG: hypothetical protein HY799_01175 [Nitrosomonadales bacterium]|nr:hypothetical protein [Nitrosomonadales bacterium]